MSNDRHPRAARLLASVALGALAALGGAAASAQTPDAADVQELVVTGSRIRGVEAVGSNVIALDREEVIATGAATTADLLKKVPQILGLGASETATSAQNGAANVTRGVGINLRGIGSNATLLLWNGRRFPSAGTQGQFTDPAVIPPLALERVEVVADGASAVYGSDAVAGVVNLILRKNFKGAESFARYGDAKAYHDYSLGQIFGTTWDGGHAMIAAEYNYHTALRGQDRDFYTSNLAPRGGTDLRANMCLPGNVVANNVFYAIPPAGVTPATVGTLVANTRNLCDNFRRQDILPKQERTSVVVSASQELGNRFRVFFDAYYSNREFELTGAGIAAAVNVPRANPFFVSPIPNATTVTVNYDFAPSAGITPAPGYALSYDVVAGVEAKLWGDWKGEAYISRGRSADAVNRRQNLNTAQLGVVLARTDPANTINLFSGQPITNQPILNEITNGQFIIKANSNLTVGNVQMDGPLFELPGGSVRLAVGGEYREEKLKGTLFSGSSVAPTTVFSAVERDVKALYGELFIPLVGADNAMPFVHRLDLSLAGRYEDYSDFGTTTNPKVGVNWQPVESFTIHGSYGRSFRAAGLGEVDPRSSGFGLYGDTLPGPNGNQFGIGIAGGNEDLKPEKAETWSVGVNFRPEPFPGFEVDVTYFEIDYKNQILALRGTPGLLTNPLYAPYRILNPTPAQVQALLASGLPINTPINAAQVTFIADGRRQNLGATNVKGFDFSINYAWSTVIGDFDAGLNGEYFTQFETATAPGATPVDVLDTINFPQDFRARANFGWRSGAFSANAFVNYIDSYTQNTVTPVRKISNYTTMDVNLAVDLGELSDADWLDSTIVSLNAQNLFDRDPPFANLAGGYDSQSVNPIGRLVAVTLRKRW